MTLTPGNGSFNRRQFLAVSAATCGALALPSVARAQSTRLSVLSPTAPDPAPPGVAPFSIEALEAWKIEHDTAVDYDARIWMQLREELVAELFATGDQIHDLLYTFGWIPDFAGHLVPIGEQLSESLIEDLPPSCLDSASWNGSVYGGVFTLSLLTLYYNRTLLEAAGFTTPPANWDELKAVAAATTSDGSYGWIANYGAREGIGGLASYWMAFLQQAGGTMYNESGLPVFDDTPGVEALQLMIDLMPYTDPASIGTVGISEATFNFIQGGTAMMMNWPFMWQTVQGPQYSRVVDQIGTTMLPAGAAGTASICGVDAWSVSAATANRDLALDLIDFYLSAETQKQQALVTGWLPVRLSVLADPEVQAAMPVASVVLAQARQPYSSFVTPNYDQITRAIGSELQTALLGQQSASEALANASEIVTAIVGARTR